MTLFLSNKISSSRKQWLHLTSFVEGKFPTNYLNAPISPSRVASLLFDGLVQKVQNKVDNWKERLLYQGGCLILICHALSYMATHTLVILPIPNTMIKKINSIISTFLWGERFDRAKRKWLSWPKVCKPVEEGGDGI